MGSYTCSLTTIMSPSCLVSPSPPVSNADQRVQVLPLLPLLPLLLLLTPPSLAAPTDLHLLEDLFFYGGGGGIAAGLGGYVGESFH